MPASLASDSSFHLYLIRFLSVFVFLLSPFPLSYSFFALPSKLRGFRRISSFLPLAIFSSRRFRLNFFFAQLVTTLIDAGRYSILSNFLNASLAYPGIPPRFALLKRVFTNHFSVIITRESLKVDEE